MQNQVFKTVSKQVAYGVARKQLDRGGIFDLKLGVALLRDRRVPKGSKLLSVAAGFLGIAVFDLFQIPLEAVIALALPILGLGINLASDGLEYTVGAFLLGAVLLPHLAPKSVVAQLRAERDGVLVPVNASVR